MDGFSRIEAEAYNARNTALKNSAFIAELEEINCRSNLFAGHNSVPFTIFSGAIREASNSTKTLEGYAALEPTAIIHRKYVSESQQKIDVANQYLRRAYDWELSGIPQ